MKFPIKLAFEDIGRDKKSWTTTVKSEGYIFMELKKALLSNDIEIYEKAPGLWTVFAGFRLVGTIHELETPTDNRGESNGGGE